MDEITVRAVASRTNEDEFYSFAKDNVRFIKRCAARTCRRFISESDDEWSVALIAFYEAVRCFESDKGSFKSFAAMVIKRRLMDYFDKESAYIETATDPYVFDGRFDREEISALDVAVCDKATEVSYIGKPGNTPLEDEVESLAKRIGRYGFALYDIGGCSPKTEKTKRACAKVIKAIADSDEMYSSMRRKCNLPYIKLVAIEGVTKKLLERHRKYLIVAAEILRGDYPQMQEYIKAL